MRTLAIIPARAGSKGVVGKNARPFRGIPLVAWAIKVGHETCDETLVSTDSEEIAAIARSYGAEALIRPEKLATDETPILPVLRHAIKGRDPFPEAVVVLQPSSPSPKRSELVREALTRLEKRGVTSVSSIVEIPSRYNAYRAVVMRSDDWLDTISESGELEFTPRRQDASTSYYRDGTVYAIKRGTLRSNLFYGSRPVSIIIPEIESVTIDTEDDWTRAEAANG